MINEIIASTPMLRARIPLSSDDLVYSTCYDVGRTWGEDARDDADILWAQLRRERQQHTEGEL